VIFFNNVGFLGMCGHGMIGLVTTLAYRGQIGVGEHRIETPVGVVTATLHPDGQVSVENVPSHRRAHEVRVEVPGHGPVVGDVAWGGNWFFLTAAEHLPIAFRYVSELTDFARRLRQAVNSFGPAMAAGAHARTFVLCPGGAYDRSPCGTGTSAKMACLAADGLLRPGEQWVQESVLGSTFTGSYRWHGEAIIPTITGKAYVSAETTLLIHDEDPFGWGIRP
jgi:4-hydroxyproline epimerase